MVLSSPGPQTRHTRVPLRPLDGIQRSSSDRNELNRYIASEPFVKVYREVLVGLLEYDLKLARACFELPPDKRQAVIDLLGPVVRKIIEISRRAEVTVKDVKVKDVKLKKMFPWLSPTTPQLNDFLAHAATTFEEIRALPNQLFIEKFLPRQAGGFASS